MSRASVVIVGGGIAGLTAAWDLTGGPNPDPDAPRVEILEAAESFGGSLGTTTLAGRVIDDGPDGFLASRAEARALIDELAMSEELVAIAASGASLYLRGSLHPIPAGLALGVPTSRDAVAAFGALSWRARMAALRDEIAPRRLVVADDATIGEIVRTKLGSEIAYQVVEPLVGGIQAGRIDRLSAASLVPNLLSAAQRGGSLMRALAAQRPSGPGGPTGPAFYSLRGGVGSLPARLVERLGERGVILRPARAAVALRESRHGSRRYEVDTADSITPADVVVLAGPGAVTGALCAHLDPALAALSTLTSASVAMVTLGLERDELRLDGPGTGVLVPLGTPGPDGEPMLITAITFLERKWPHLANGLALVRAHVGRVDDERFGALSDEALVARVVSELQAILGGRVVARESYVRRFIRALPQYEVGHAELVRAAKAAAAEHGLALAGNAYDGVGIPASIASGRRAASEVRAMLEKR